MADDTPIPVADVEDENPPEDLKRRPIPAYPEPVAPTPTARAIPVGSTEDLESRIAPRPLPSGRAIPITPGSTEDLEDRSLQHAEHPKSAPIQTGVASLWTKAENIHNPILRVLGEIGAGGARALDTAGQAVGRVIPAVGAVESAIPGTTMNAEAKERTQAKQDAQQADLAGKEATTEHEKAQTGAIPAETGLKEAQTAALETPPQKQGLTPDETTLHDLMTGENGQPRINPQTQQPYTYLDAYQAVKQAGQDVKPTPETKTTKVVRLVNGIPHEVLVNSQTGEDVKDEGQTKLPQDMSGKADARADKSYQLQSTRLDKIRQPVEQIIARVGRLNDTLNQNTPQADALVAPELLSIMSGGQGSGLRMNEAEISRIVGGRSKWESLKASINQWQTDPTKARSITPEQDKQIRALVDTVHQKLVKKQAILDGAEESLINSDDPKQHREIVAGARKQLDAIDAASEGGPKPGDVENGYKFKGGDASNKANWEKVETKAAEK